MRTAARAGPTCASRSPQSVNFYYYKLAYDMGIERFDEYMRKYGFGAPTGIDLAGENQRHRAVAGMEGASARKEPWYPGETVIAGIGQGYWVATTLQLARGTAAIANGGACVRPHLVAARRDGYDAPWTPLPQPAPPRITDNPAHLRAVQEGMVATMQPRRHRRGASARGAPYLMAGKTGTAQKISRKRQRERGSALSCRTTCATRRCSSATRRPTTRRSRSRWRSSTAASARSTAGADRAQDLRRVAAGQDAGTGAAGDADAALPAHAASPTSATPSPAPRPRRTGAAQAPTR